MFECVACVLVRWVEPFTLRPAVTGQWQHRRMPNLATELVHLLLTPLAYVFIAIFLIALGSFTFQIGRFFDTNQADLAPFFL